MQTMTAAWLPGKPIRYGTKVLCSPCCVRRLQRTSPNPVIVVPQRSLDPPPRRRSTGEKVPTPWRALGSRNGVDRGHRRPGEPPPRNRLATPRLMWPAGARLRHAGGLHAVSSQILPALGHRPCSPGRVLPGMRHTPPARITEKAADGRTRHGCLTSSLYSASSGECSGPWSNLMRLPATARRK